MKASITHKKEKSDRMVTQLKKKILKFHKLYCNYKATNVIMKSSITHKKEKSDRMVTQFKKKITFSQNSSKSLSLPRFMSPP